VGIQKVWGQAMDPRFREDDEEELGMTKKSWG